MSIQNLLTTSGSEKENAGEDVVEGQAALLLEDVGMVTLVVKRAASRGQIRYCQRVGDPWVSTTNSWATHGRPMRQHWITMGDPWSTHGRHTGQHYKPTGDPWASATKSWVYNSGPGVTHEF